MAKRSAGTFTLDDELKEINIEIADAHKAIGAAQNIGASTDLHYARLEKAQAKKAELEYARANDHAPGPVTMVLMLDRSSSDDIQFIKYYTNELLRIATYLKSAGDVAMLAAGWLKEAYDISIEFTDTVKGLTAITETCNPDYIKGVKLYRKYRGLTDACNILKQHNYNPYTYNIY